MTSHSYFKTPLTAHSRLIAIKKNKTQVFMVFRSPSCISTSLDVDVEFIDLGDYENMLIVVSIASLPSLVCEI
jgi:hypothetical protein